MTKSLLRPLTSAGQGPAQGFASPVGDSQSTFRALMSALAEPGTVHEVASPLACCPGLSPAMTAVALTLADFETSVWIAGSAPDACTYLRFHTGAAIVTDREAAALSFVPIGHKWPSFDGFRQGDLEYPDRSTTVIVDVEAFTKDHRWRLSGPGINSTRRFGARPVPSDFIEQLAINRSLFPCGVDIVFCTATTVAALPRTTRVEAD